MPIYEYQCKKCKAHTEILQKITDKPLTKCKKCGGRLEKQWSPTSFQLKGSGWYVTDYAAKKTETKEAKSGAKEETSKADAKDAKEEKAAKKDTVSTSEKATPAESSPSKKSGSSSTAPSSGD